MTAKRPNNTIDLFYELVRTDFVLRYRNSVLGFVWVLLKPFLLFLILVIVFSWVFKSHDPYYRYNLLLGVIIFSYFSESTQRGVISLWEKSSIILKVNFPKALTIYTSVFNSLISFFASLVVYVFFWLITKPVETTINLPYFLLQIFILTCLIAGLNFFLSIGYIFLRDLSSIWEILARLLFYASPIIYPASLVPNRFSFFYFLNPLATIITESRKALITGEAFSWQRTVIALAIALTVLFFGRYFFNAKVKYVAERF
jgi:ABC-type polysaccharide/polyol phosphate export permease